MTQETESDEWAEIIAVDKAVEATFEAYRGTRLAGSPAPRAMLAFSIDAVQHARLIGLLAANLKGTVTLRIVDIRVPLPDEDEEPAPPARNAGQLALETSTGETVLEHKFLASVDDFLKCQICGAGPTNPIHAGDEVSNLERGLLEELQTPQYDRHHFVDSLADPLKCAACSLPASDAIHEDPDAGELAGPEDPTGPDEQAAARDRLASRSRSK